MPLKRSVSRSPGRKRASQRAVADSLFSKLVRSEGRCAYKGNESINAPRFAFAHGGNLQCAHVLSRRYLAVRFERMNAMCLCAAHHVAFTNAPLEWEDWCREQLGSAVYDELRRKALAGGRPDYAVLIPKLRAAVERAWYRNDEPLGSPDDGT